MRKGVWLSVALWGCAAFPRFRDAPIVWRVRDDANISRPEKHAFHRYEQAYDWFVGRRLVRALELRSSGPARNTNALDEVPNSSWFTNRIGVRDLPPEEIAVAASAAGPPRLPLVAVSGKPGGMNPGVVAQDAIGRRFIIKFDAPENPELQTAAHVIVNRLIWALGYHVPSDTLFTMRREQITAAPGATYEDLLGEEQALTEQSLDEVYATAPQRADGSYRVAASEFVPGIPVGGWPAEGVRPDDPNDVVPHEHRRELRGLKIAAAWVNQTDMKEDNTLDAYVEVDGRHFLRHYLIDFGQALGALSASRWDSNGYERRFDWQAQPLSFFSFGLWLRDWELLEPTPWPSIGRFTAKNFHPESWKDGWAYWPFFETDPADAFWAARLIMRFTRDQIQAAVREGQLTQPGAEQYLVDTLFQRRERIGRAFFERVSPLSRFEISPSALCTVDESVAFGLLGSSTVRVLDEDDHVVFSRIVDPRGQVCIPIHRDERYRVYRLQALHHERALPVMQVHFKGGKDARLLGLLRLER